MDQKRRDFSDFYAPARDDCLRIVLVSVGIRQLAEDLVAESFTRARMAWRKVSSSFGSGWTFVYASGKCPSK